jgi:hypothetical protein
MITEKKNDQQGEQKKWENPTNPREPVDEREQEQILRQYKEAKRRKENLTGTDEAKQTKN